MNTLGKWKSPPHFVWPWIYDPDSLLLYVLQANGFRVHEATQIGTRFTRTSTKFKQTSHVVQLALGEYVSVLAISTVNGIVYDSPTKGGLWTEPVPTITEFWQYIIRWGGNWMWEMIFPDMMDGFDGGWLISSLRNGTLRGVTDGSYSKTKDPSMRSRLDINGHIFWSDTRGQFFRVIRLRWFLSRRTFRSIRHQCHSYGPH